MTNAGVLFFPNGNASVLVDYVDVPVETVTAAIRVCRQYGAADVLPMLGVLS